jgi:hypothetical protein
MRHLFGIVLAVVTAAAIFFGAGWAMTRITNSSLLFTSHASKSNMAALATLAGIGLLIGIVVAVRRISPLAAGLPGIALIAWSVLFAFNTPRGLQAVPLKNHAFGQGFTELLGLGVTALAGAVLIIPLFMPSRWRRWDREDDYYSDVPSGIGLMR